MLDAKKVQVTEERQSKKAPMSDAEARRLLDSVAEVVLARGKSIRRLTRAEATLDDLRGQSGGFRAPMVRRGKTLLVGFHEEQLNSLLR